MSREYFVYGQARIQDFSRGGGKLLLSGKFCAHPLAPPWNNLFFCEFAREARNIFWPPSDKFYEGQSQI